MPDEILQPPVPEAETSPPPKDLRAELDANLKSEFTANLSEAGSLPKAVSDSLVALLGLSGPISADVIAALSLNDSTQPEKPDE